MIRMLYNIFLIQTIITQQNILPIDLNIKTYSDYQNQVSGIKLFQGQTYNEMDDDFQILQLDLSYSDILIGDKSKINWGLNCNESINSCEIIKKNLDQQTYINSKFFADYSQSFFRFNNKDSLNIDLKSSKLNFSLINSVLRWPLGKYGVLGLNPNGNFIKYLKNIYENQDITFQINYLFNSNSTQDQPLYDLKFVINPQQDLQNLSYDLTVDQNEEINIKGTVKTNDNNILKQYDFCIRGVSNNLFNIKNSSNICKVLKQQVCNDVNNCNKSNAQLDDSESLLLLIGDSTIKFEQEDYFYFDYENNLQCRFDEYQEQQFNCGQDQDATLEKYFFTKYSLKLTYQKDNKTTLSLFKLREKEKVPSVIFYLAIFASLIALFFFIYQGFLKKKEEKDNEIYVEIKRKKVDRLN